MLKEKIIKSSVMLILVVINIVAIGALIISLRAEIIAVQYEKNDEQQEVQDIIKEEENKDIINNNATPINISKTMLEINIISKSILTVIGIMISVLLVVVLIKIKDKITKK